MPCVFVNAIVATVKTTYDSNTNTTTRHTDSIERNSWKKEEKKETRQGKKFGIEGAFDAGPGRRTHHRLSVPVLLRPRAARFVETTLARPLVPRLACAPLQTAPIDPPTRFLQSLAPRHSLSSFSHHRPFSRSFFPCHSHPLSARTLARKIQQDTSRIFAAAVPRCPSSLSRHRHRLSFYITIHLFAYCF